VNGRNEHNQPTQLIKKISAKQINQSNTKTKSKYYQKYKKKTKLGITKITKK